jgi:hypothetical protein
MYKEKYLKYKTKYLNLKSQIGGGKGDGPTHAVALTSNGAPIPADALTSDVALTSDGASAPTLASTDIAFVYPTHFTMPKQKKHNTTYAERVRINQTKKIINSMIQETRDKNEEDKKDIIKTIYIGLTDKEKEDIKDELRGYSFNKVHEQFNVSRELLNQIKIIENSYKLGTP